MPLQQTSGAASYDAFGGGVPVAAKYIEDFFQTWLRTGTGASATVTTGLNSSINKSLVWTKSRSGATNHKLTDTVRGATKALSSNTTGAEATDSQGLTAFSSTGYTIGTSTDYNNSGATYADWQFVATPKFFDVVTYTGNGSTDRDIAHSLASVPGFVLIKPTSTSGDWAALCRMTDTNYAFMRLNGTNAASTWGGESTPSTFGLTSTNINVGKIYLQDPMYPGGGSNVNGVTYVAYIFAHNAGGFGLTGTDNVISCGSFTVSGNAATVNLGYEPQWLLIKSAASVSAWDLFDSMRGLQVSGNQPVLNANNSGAEFGTGSGVGVNVTSTGFATNGYLGNGDHIYIAIRRGPMKTPTTGTSVFSPVAYTGGTVASPRPIEAGFPPDFLISNSRTLGSNHNVGDKLRGRAAGVLRTNTTNAELPPNSSSDDIVSFDQNGVTYGNAWNAVFNASNDTYVSYFFRRAPGFFDVVCYTGTGSNLTLNHNLGVTPELIITKRRNGATYGAVYASSLGVDQYLELFSSSTGGRSAAQTFSGSWLTPTSTTFGVGVTDQNLSAATYVAYLFSTVIGVSKVGSYTGNGSSQTINCGFTGGARFVLIKRTNAAGDWVVFDSARGIVSGNDPFLELNTTAAEQTGQDAVDTDSTGFVVNETTENLNVNGASYIFLAIS